MQSIRTEQRVDLKFLVKPEKTAAEAHVMLKGVYGSECLSRAQVFEWFKKFKEGRETTKDEPRPGRQCPENWSPKVRQSINIITSRF